MLPSNPGTQWHVVSAGIALEHVPKPHTVTVKTYSLFHSDHESFADVREVSADLETTHILRGLPHVRRLLAGHRHSTRYLDKHGQRLCAPL